ncbi:hypothetical protein SAMD00024442_37_19 [Candidatus Symbiothrix dinenymphae]|nr:hypothetical protein SAMD00024442_37_19 [Candidatus Symbiothrix dinenymphae]
MIYIANKKSKEENIRKKYPNALILDISSKGKMPWVKLSPFYPHGNIPIPFSEGKTSQTVEGIWQGLKVFEGEDIDVLKFEIKSMEGIKRTVRKFGKPLGHRKGINGKELLDYLTARKEIYLHTYAWVLDNLVQDVLLKLKNEVEKQDVVLLDYNTNQENIYTSYKPLSHAFLVKRYLEKKYPELVNLAFKQPLLLDKITDFILNKLKNNPEIAVAEVKEKFKLKTNKEVKEKYLEVDKFNVFKRGSKEMIKLKPNQSQLFDNQ